MIAMLSYVQVYFGTFKKTGPLRNSFLQKLGATYTATGDTSDNSWAQVDFLTDTRQPGARGMTGVCKLVPFARKSEHSAGMAGDGLAE